MINNKMRAEFEEWINQSEVFKNPEWLEDVGQYNYTSTQIMWEAWQASRAALVVELPEEPEDLWGAMPYDRGQVDGMIVMLDDCKSSLDVAGVKYK